MGRPGRLGLELSWGVLEASWGRGAARNSLWGVSASWDRITWGRRVESCGRRLGCVWVMDVSWGLVS